MADKNKTSAAEQRQKAEKTKEIEKINKVEDKKVQETALPEQPKKEEKEAPKEILKAEKQKQIKKKEEAITVGTSLHISKKHSMYICDFIKNKSVDQSIRELEEVIKLKRAIPFKGEIPHRRHLGIMSGRYPVNAAKQFIYLLKSLKGNIIVNGLDLDKTKIYFGCANWANRPARGGGMRFKRTNVTLKAKEFPVKEEKK